jgi:hypothetical protein
MVANANVGERWGKRLLDVGVADVAIKLGMGAPKLLLMTPMSAVLSETEQMQVWARFKGKVALLQGKVPRVGWLSVPQQGSESR